MKLWRKLAKKVKTDDLDSVVNFHTGEVLSQSPIYARTGRNIRYEHYVGEQMTKRMKKSYPLLDSLFNRAGIEYVLTQKQQEALKTMYENASSDQHEETANEAK